MIAVPELADGGGAAALKPVGATAGTVMVTVVLVSEPTELVAVTAKENVPGAVGVPDSVPAEESVKPVGSVPFARLYAGTGEPFAAKV